MPEYGLLGQNSNERSIFFFTGSSQERFVVGCDSSSGVELKYNLGSISLRDLNFL